MLYSRSLFSKALFTGKTSIECTGIFCGEGEENVARSLSVFLDEQDVSIKRKQLIMIEDEKKERVFKKGPPGNDMLQVCFLVKIRENL